jgi:virginiamycin B lyase
MDVADNPSPVCGFFWCDKNSPNGGAIMKMTRLLATALTGMAVMLVHAVPGWVEAQNPPAAALTGMVRSQEEGAMEGVLVSAKRAGSTVTTTVVSNAQGRYSFPRARLEPGHYSVSIRAAGYELASPVSAVVAEQKPTQLNLKLGKAHDLAPQLSNGEWLASMPGTDEQKQPLLGCISCHTLERIVRSRYKADEFLQVIRRMDTYGQGSMPQRPQVRAAARERSQAQQQAMAKLAQYVSTINLSSISRWEYSLKTLPRPNGKATRVIITEYDLPRSEAMPHDAVVDSEGMVWYSDFGSQYLGRLDPKTAKAAEFPVPITKPGAPTGALDLGFDPDGNVWLGMMNQGSIAKFDRKTEKFQVWSAPGFLENNEARLAMVDAVHFNQDGKVWIGGDNEYQLDLKTGEWHVIDYSRGLPKDVQLANRLSSYAVLSDSRNNFYGLNLNGKYIIRIDAKTLNVTPFPTVTANSGPRRGHMDAQDRLWFAEFRGNIIGVFDTKTEQFREWTIPTSWTNPYDAVVDKQGYVWTGGMSNDHVVRLNTKTDEMTEYLLPRSTNIRRVNVDNSTNPPTFWVGNNHGAAIIKIEPLG